MEKSKQIKTKMARVKEILTQQPSTRDNDRELIVEYWRTEQPQILKFTSAEVLLLNFINGSLSNPDDITRTRRLVQMHNPSLRGTKQQPRQAAEKEVRMNINN